MAQHILILGAGIAGLTTALALHKYLPNHKSKITIFEIRASPSTIGGAVNLTPKPLRYVDHLGVYDVFTSKELGAECQTIDIFDLSSGSKYAAVSFEGAEGKGVGKEGQKPFFSRRVMRREIQNAMLELVKSLEGVDVVFGTKVVQMQETDSLVQRHLKDGETRTGDCLLGSGPSSSTPTANHLRPASPSPWPPPPCPPLQQPPYHHLGRPPAS